MEEPQADPDVDEEQHQNGQSNFADDGKLTRRNAFKTIGGGLMGSALFAGIGSATETNEDLSFDPNDPEEVLDVVEIVERREDTSFLEDLDEEQRDAINDAFVLSWVESVGSQVEPGDRDIKSYRVNVVDKEMGRRWDWGSRPRGIQRARQRRRETIGNSNSEETTSDQGEATSSVSSARYRDTVRGVSWLGFTVYRWTHDVRWEYDGERVSNVRPNAFASDVSTVWSYEGLVSAPSPTFNSARTEFTSFRQGRFSGPGLSWPVDLRYTTNPLIEIRGNKSGSGRTTRKETY